MSVTVLSTTIASDCPLLKPSVNRAVIEKLDVLPSEVTPIDSGNPPTRGPPPLKEAPPLAGENGPSATATWMLSASAGTTMSLWKTITTSVSGF
jgi:hypothetical protein